MAIDFGGKDFEESLSWRRLHVRSYK